MWELEIEMERSGNTLISFYIRTFNYDDNPTIIINVKDCVSITRLPAQPI